MQSDHKPTRRRFLGRTLWGAALTIFGVLPAGLWASGMLPGTGRSRWSLLAPRPVDWTMKPLSSATIDESVLPDGRVVLRIQHDLLRGVTTDMLVWWWHNIEGGIELNGQTYPRYLVWHPIDHIYFRVLKRLADGNVGVGSIFHLVEALGADMTHLIDVALYLRKLDETGGVVELPVLGRSAMRIEGRFVPHEGGTQVTSTMTAGFSSWVGTIGLNRLLLGWFFPPERRRAWLKHSVEEIGNLQFFLPELYCRYAPSDRSSRAAPACRT
jgi:hypothetical protein